MDSFTERMKHAQRQLEAEKADPPPSTECFCYICGGTSTWRQLLKRSTFLLSGSDEENDAETLYDDRCNCRYGRVVSEHERHSDSCGLRKGYDQRLISLQDTKWLGDVRMISYYEENTRDRDIENCELLTPIADVDYGRNYGESWKFRRSDCCFFVRSQGCLVHDACLGILKQVHRETVGATRLLNLRQVLLVVEVSAKERDSKDFDWGFGNTFDGAFGAHHRLYYQYWNPVENSEWTVMDPQKAIDLQPLVSEASKTSKPGFSFKFQGEQEVVSKSRNQTDSLWSISTELRLRVLKMLPTNSVLNLFLASPAFRVLSLNLPQGFWRSRLFFDVPWCADAALAQVAQQGIHPFPFEKLLRLIREASKPGMTKLDQNSGHRFFIKDSMVLKNRRRVWINSERIIRDIEARHTDSASALSTEEAEWRQDVDSTRERETGKRETDQRS